MKRIVIKISLSLIFIISCSVSVKKIADSDNWEIINAKGFPNKDFEVTGMIFFNQSDGILLGSESSFDSYLNNTLISDQVATICFTTDGGKNWQKNTYKKGSFLYPQLLDGNLTRVYKSVFSGKGMGKFEYFEIFESKDFGRSWSNCNKIDFEFVGISFADAMNGIAILQPEKSDAKQIFATHDGGKSWKNLKFENFYLNNNIQIKGDDFYLLGRKVSESQGYNNIIKVSSKTFSIITTEVPIGKIDNIHIDKNGEFWFLKNVGNKSEIYHQEGSEFRLFIQIEAENTLIVKEINRWDKVVQLVVSETAVPIVKFRYFRTEDFGVTWQEEKLPLGLMAKPSAYYEGSDVWLFAGANRIQHRK